MCLSSKPRNAAGGKASFRATNHAVTVLQPSIEVNGITTMRLQRLHFSSRPCPQTLAMSWPHSHRVSVCWQEVVGVLLAIMEQATLFLMKLRTILNISTAERMSSIDSLISPCLGRLDRALINMVAYNGIMKSRSVMLFRLSGIAAMLCICGLYGCVAEAPVALPSMEIPMVLVSGRVVVVITGDRGRRFGPEVRYVELFHRARGERYKVTIDSDDKAFTCFLPAGEYEITRVQISEGPFLSIAQLSSTLSIGGDPLVFVGTWRFGIDSPRYGRMVLVSMIPEEQTRLEAEVIVRTQYPALARKPLHTVIPSPAETETRLYEVLPYPRYPKYFQRHLW